MLGVIMEMKVKKMHKCSKNKRTPFVPLQLERSFKFMRETEDQLRIIPQFCFPDAKDWKPEENYPRWECERCHNNAVYENPSAVKYCSTFTVYYVITWLPDWTGVHFVMFLK